MQSPSAACAIHPDLGAVFTCERCGVFGCEDCRGPSQPSLCQACTRRVEPAGELTVRALLQDSFRLLGRNLSGVGLLLVIHLLWVSVLPLFPDLDRNGALFFMLSCGSAAFSTGAFLSWTAAGLLHQPRSVLSALGVGLLRFPFLLPLYGLFACFVRSGALFLLPPVLFLAVCVSLVPALVVLDGLNSFEAVELSFRLTRGYRLTLLAVYAVSGLLAIMGALLGQLCLTLLPELNVSVWLGAGFFGLMHALCSALLYGSVVLAWRRLTGGLVSST